jgi:hypothetical protein
MDTDSFTTDSGSSSPQVDTDPHGSSSPRMDTDYTDADHKLKKS